MPSFIDLHTHTTASDGELAPAELVRRAEESALSAIAITDHDTVEGFEEAKAASIGLDIEVIPGIEMSADFDGEMHILGLFVDPYAAILQGAMHDMQMWRGERNEHMIMRLADLGTGISREDVLAKAKTEQMESVGRVHIALALVEKGAAESVEDAFARYISSGGEGYVPRKRFSPEKCIEIIKSSGGYAFLAHPVYSVPDVEKLEELVEELAGYGLDGIECYHSSQSYEYSEQCLKICARHNLMVSGGSDFHGVNKPNVQLGRVYDGKYVDFELLRKIKLKIGMPVF